MSDKSELPFYRRSYRSSQLQHKRSLFRIGYAYRVRRFSRKPVFLNFKMQCMDVVVTFRSRALVTILNSFPFQKTM
jgi:hypothetical protein